MPLNAGDGVGFQRSFDFSKFRNLQEVDLRVSWMGGGLLWIPKALSTLKPATSPRLSTIQLSFARPFHSYALSAQMAIEATGNDLRLASDEFARIEHEFKGRVNVTVFRDETFEVVLATLNVRFHSCVVGDTSR